MTTRQAVRLSLGLVVAVTIPGCAHDPIEASSPRTEVAHFEFVQPAAPADRFVIEVTDPEKIKHARALVAGSTRSPSQIMGLVVKSPAPYNRGWRFHLDPASISFFEMAVEVCDATARYVDDHLAEVGGAFLPGKRWCPWQSMLVTEAPMTSDTSR